MIKSILLVMVFAFSSVSYAKVSVRYVSAISNPDGSTTYLGPLTTSVGNKVGKLDADSFKPDSVCESLGKKISVGAVTGILVASDRRAVIDSSEKVEIVGDAEGSGYYKSIVCRIEKPTSRVSTQHSGIISNPDGSKSILSPRFDFNGNRTPISAGGSAFDGVCKLFGFAKYLASETRNISAKGSFPGIDEEGRMSSLELVDGVASIYRVVVCSQENFTPVASPQHSGMVHYADGSIVISKPRFDFAGVPSRIFVGSETAGVCKLFGFYASIDSAEESLEVPLSLPVINGDGQISNIVERTGVFKTVTCFNP